MDPKVWGPGLWLALHSITLNYPHYPTEKEKEEITNFFILTGKVLPCFYCRDNFRRHLKEYPINVDSKTELVNWLIDIHNDVNKEIGKPVLSRKEALEKILCMYRKEYQNPESVLLIYFGIIFIFIFIIYFLF
jgi:mitochondrial FAD-linked sulfhydryl oxidase